MEQHVSVKNILPVLLIALLTGLGGYFIAMWRYDTGFFAEVERRPVAPVVTQPIGSVDSIVPTGSSENWTVYTNVEYGYRLWLPPLLAAFSEGDGRLVLKDSQYSRDLSSTVEVENFLSYRWEGVADGIFFYSAERTQWEFTTFAAGFQKAEPWGFTNDGRTIFRFISGDVGAWGATYIVPVEESGVVVTFVWGYDSNNPSFPGTEVVDEFQSTLEEIIKTLDVESIGRGDSSLTLQQVKNTEYLLGVDQYRLADGEYRGIHSIGKGDFGTTPHSVVLQDSAFGDVDRDGAVDAVVVLSQNTGGTGHFKELVFMRNEDGFPDQVTSKSLGDRIVVNSLYVWEDGSIILDLVTHGPGDGLCCPSLDTTKRFWFVEGELLEAKG
jgi:hypothetical protein